MYSFGEVGNGKQLNIANVREMTDDENLWRYYFGSGFDFKSHKSPLRVNDNSASFSIFKATRVRPEKIMAKDHNGSFCGDIFEFIKAKEGLNMYGALVRINLDFNLGFSYDPGRIGGIIQPARYMPNLLEPSEPLLRRRMIYTVEERSPAFQSDIDYWALYGITPKTLRRYQVRCVNVLRCNGICVYTYTPGNPCYQYPFPSGNSKFYWPREVKGKKFRGNIDNERDFQGYYECRVKTDYEGKMLVLTKSMKDVMLFHEFDVDAMAIHGEGHKPLPAFIEHLKRHYPRIITLYDNDDSGRRGAQHLEDEYGIQKVFIPEGDRKDITDMFRWKGKKAVEEFIQNVIKR